MKVKITVETPLIIGGCDEMLEIDLFEDSGILKIIDFNKTAANLTDDDATMWERYLKELISLKGVPGKSFQSDKYGTAESKVSQIMEFYKNLYKLGRLITYSNKIEYEKADFWKYGGITPTIHHIFERGGGSFMEPYIPGSSVKGAIRRSLLFDIIKRDEAIKSGPVTKKASELLLGDNYQGSHRNKFDDGEIFKLSVRYSPQTDMMRFVTVSDFVPTGPFTLELVQLSRKSGMRDQRSNYIAVTSGSFIGEISINRSIFTQLLGKRDRNDEFLKLSKILNLSESDLIKAHKYDNSDFAKVEENLLRYICEKVANYAVENGKKVGYNVEGRKDIIILGFGKGAPLTTVLNASSAFLQEALTEMRKMRMRKYPKSIAEPKTLWIVNGKNGLSRPGLCKMEMVH